MSKMWFCRNCGYEVPGRGRCHRCRARLTESPLAELAPGDDDDEVGYRIADWSDASRVDLIVGLIEANVVHRFEDDELVVKVDDEARTDELIDQVTSHVVADADGEIGEEAVDPALAADLVALADASRRLVADPTDMDADADASSAAAAVFVHDQHPLTDDATWAAVGRVTRRLTGALASDEAMDEEITTQAAILVKLVGPMTGGREPGVELVGPMTEGRERGVELVGPMTGGREPGVEPADAQRERADTGAVGTADEDDGGGRGGERGNATGDDDAPAGAAPGEPHDVVAGPVERRPGAGTSVYELPEWQPEQRAELSVLLDRAGVHHEWEGGDLAVAVADEDAVEALFDEVEGVVADEDDEARYRALEALFAASGRVVGDPANRSRRTELVRAVADVEGPTPLGVDDARWLSIRNRARSLAELIDADAANEAVRDGAATLRDDLRALV